MMLISSRVILWRCCGEGRVGRMTIRIFRPPFCVSAVDIRSPRVGLQQRLLFLYDPYLRLCI